MSEVLSSYCTVVELSCTSCTVRAELAESNLFNDVGEGEILGQIRLLKHVFVSQISNFKMQQLKVVKKIIRNQSEVRMS
jgi:hypothetical protein